MPNTQKGQERKRRAAHYFTYFDGGTHSANKELSAWESWILPVQFFSDPDKNEPEHLLFWAILESAIGDYQNGFFSDKRRDQRLFREAEEWFLSEDDSFITAFERICQNLEINSNYLRKGLRKMKDTFLEKKAQGLLTKKDKKKLRPFVMSNTNVTSGSHKFIDKLPHTA